MKSTVPAKVRRVLPSARTRGTDDHAHDDPLQPPRPARFRPGPEAGREWAGPANPATLRTWAIPVSAQRLPGGRLRLPARAC